jgi:hypothetical protein
MGRKYTYEKKCDLVQPALNMNRAMCVTDDLP